MVQAPPDLVAPKWLQFLRRYIWFVAFVFGAITLTLIRPLTRHVPEPPAVMFQLPEYELVDQHERPFVPQTLEGKVWVAGFVFTSCPSSCPAVTQAMVQLRDRFGRNAMDVEFVSISVDPRRDTPRVLREYAERVGAVGDNWRFVTGEPEAVHTLVRDGFKLGLGEREQSGATYDITHSNKLALVDGHGGVRGYYGIEAEGLDELFHRADRVLMTQ
jgi:protein SCO1/2